MVTHSLRPHSLPASLARAALLASLLVMSGTAVQAAHVVTFVGGGTMEVESFRMEGARIVVTLEGGGEVAFTPQRVSGIARAPVSPVPAAPPKGENAPPQAPATSPTPPPTTPVVSPWDPEPGVRALIQQVAVSLEVDARLLAALVETESRFDPFAVSRKGAMGLMQLMPATARRYEVENVFDPRENLEGGTRYLKELLGRYGDTALALAAYNAGEEAVDRYGGIPPYRETRGYVARILGRLQP